MSLLTKANKAIGATLFAATLSLSTAVSAASMPGAVVEAGQLVGLTNITVEGFGLYNVSFHDTFQGTTYSKAFADKAGEAAISLGTGSGLFQGSLFDYRPELTRGCGDLSSPSVSGSQANSLCIWVVVTDVMNTIGDGVAFSNFDQANDMFDHVFSFVDIPGINYQDVSYTNWTRVSEVPVPAAAFMFAPALLGFLGLRRRMKS